MKSKKCFLSPDATDDLCFWRCLGIHFNKRKTNKIKRFSKQGCVQQKLDALEFKKQFYSDTRNDHPDIVCEDQYKDIATKFEIRLMIFQLNAQGGAELIHDLNAKSQNICKLHYDADECHFLYIKKLSSYTGLPEGDIYCPECAKPFKYNDAKRSLKTHIRHHQTKEKKIAFKKDHKIN